ncbi:glycoside hydrolase family 18 protein [Melanomma pulvis-pyrius CBS 109.77]|uniref:chitinase n=1 Tax=Melanomma pulvis-pyrius CBS 109.77 TaxID=1314802 RepID=A0A6A6XGM8_9PLEO|nr:glycoside hydrolase family 18 protein [Melanomma pulvis-pyrius CBS 109.77]
MHFISSVLLFSTPLIALAAPFVDHASTKGYEVGTFYVNWAIYGRQHFVTDLPSTKLTKVNYAFANINATTGEVFLSDPWADVQFHYPTDVVSNITNSTILYGNFNQLFKLKQQNRNLKTVLSVGGWSYRGNFKTALATEETREVFAQSALELVMDLGLDGFDVDWEYPEDETDAANLVEAVKRLRELFDEYSAEHADGYHFEITISAPAGPLRYSVLPIAALDAYVDEWNLMAFDYAGPGFSNTTGHLSNVYPSTSNPASTDFNTAQAIAYYTSHISSPSKIILGMPLYGRSFAHTTGMGKPFNGSGDGTWEAGVLDYKFLPLNGSTVYTDRKVVASWSYDNRTGQLVTYDTPEIQTLKTQYLKREGLGGAWWWDSSSDSTGETSLVNTVSEALGGVGVLKKKENCLTYPGSKYDNVRGQTAVARRH